MKFFKNIFLFCILSGIAFGADSQLVNQIGTQAESLLQQILKVVGNLGVGLSVLSLAFICFALMSDNQKVRDSINKALIAVMSGVIVKFICVTTTSFLNLF